MITLRLEHLANEVKKFCFSKEQWVAIRSLLFLFIFFVILLKLGLQRSQLLVGGSSIRDLGPQNGVFKSSLVIRR